MSSDILSVLKETRVFPPPPEFQGKAHIKSMDEYRALYRLSVEDPEGFWAEQAGQPTSPRCAFWARWGSRSTPKPGCGTAR